MLVTRVPFVLMHAPSCPSPLQPGTWRTISERRQQHGSKLNASASSSSSSPPSDHEGHAFLHDFCMTIPFSVIGMVASAALAILGSSVSLISQSIPLLAAASVILGLTAVLSLSLWRKGQIGTTVTSLVTLVSGAQCLLISYQSWTCLKLKSIAGSSLTFILWPLLILSGCLTLFAFYNVLAGGNPPAKSKK